MRVIVNDREIDVTTGGALGFVRAMNDMNLIEKVSVEENTLRVRMIGGVEYIFEPEEHGEELELFVDIVGKINSD